MLYQYLIAISGYLLNKAKNNDDSIVIPISKNMIMGRQAKNIKESDSPKFKFEIKLILKILYICFIFAVISWSIIYSIIETISTRTMLKLAKNIFQILFSIQFVCGIIYFRKTKFKILNKIKEIRHNFNILLSVLTIISICLSVSKIILFRMEIGTTPAYSSIGNCNIYVTLLLFLDRFYSYQTFLINATIFVVMMIYHKNKISSLVEKLSTYVGGRVSDIKTAHSIRQNFILIKNEFEKSVEELETFFQTLTVIGLINLYYFLQYVRNNIVTVDDIFDLIIFFIIELVYIFSIQQIQTKRDKINDIVNSILNVTIDLESDGNVIDIDPTNAEQHNVLMVQLYEIASRSSDIDSLKTLILILQSDWKLFKVFGITIDGTTLMNKIFGFVISIMVAVGIITISS